MGYYETNFKYLDEVAANPVPYLEISWTTRFNAFLPEGNPWNYLTPDSEIPEKNYETDNEGKKLWPEAGKNIDTVNIMAYDAGGIKFNFETILKNFVGTVETPALPPRSTLVLSQVSRQQEVFGEAWMWTRPHHSLHLTMAMEVQ